MYKFCKSEQQNSWCSTIIENNKTQSRTVLVVQTKATRQTQTGTPLVKPKQESVIPVIPCKYTQYF